MRRLLLLPSLLFCSMLALSLPAQAADPESDDTRLVLLLTELGAQMQLGSGGTIAAVTLQGESIDDEAIKLLKDAKHLSMLTLNDTRVTGEGLAHLQDLPNLRRLAVMHAPLSDLHVDQLVKLKSVTHFHLHGTRMSDMGRQRLLDQLKKSGRESVTVDIHSGAFLGVAGSYGVSPVVVTQVIPDSGADEAGLQVRDIILKYDGQDVANFQQLAAMVGHTPIDQTVKVVIRRGEEQLTKTVLLKKRPS